MTDRTPINWKRVRAVWNTTAGQAQAMAHIVECMAQGKLDPVAVAQAQVLANLTRDNGR